MKIYTKTGDKGQTRLVGGSIVSKTHPRLEAYGTIDELNSLLGVCLAECSNTHEAWQNQAQPLKNQLLRIQNDLFFIGSRLSSETEEILSQMPALPQDSIDLLEKGIDEMEKTLTPLKQFILPSGHKVATLLHLARTVCRRGERHVVLICENEQPSLTSEIIYLNRLSDYLFVAARFINHLSKTAELFWKKEEMR